LVEHNSLIAEIPEEKTVINNIAGEVTASIELLRQEMMKVITERLKIAEEFKKKEEELRRKGVELKQKEEELEKKEEVLRRKEMELQRKQEELNKKLEKLRKKEPDPDPKNFWACSKCGALFPKDEPYTLVIADEELLRTHLFLNRLHWETEHRQVCDGQLIEAAEKYKDNMEQFREQVEKLRGE